MKICSVEGCDKKFAAKGLCADHYYRLRKHGDPLGGNIDRGAVSKYLESALLIDTEECINWPYAKKENGYGTAKLDGKQQYVHRYVCERFYGAPNFEKAVVAHSCNNGHLGCFNPKHLRWTTQKDNMADKKIHETQPFGSEVASSKLTEEDIPEIFKMVKLGFTEKEIAAQFNVARQTINSIKIGRLWSNLTGIEWKKGGG